MTTLISGTAAPGLRRPGSLPRGQAFTAGPGSGTRGLTGPAGWGQKTSQGMRVRRAAKGRAL